MASLIIFSAIVVFVYMTLWWIFSLVTKRNDVADVAWGLGFVILALALFIRSGSYYMKSYIILGMVCIWGLRLATHIALRHRGKLEDKRYQKMSEHWKYKHLQAYFNVFLLQGFFLLLVATPIILFFFDNTHIIHWYNIIGFVVWVFGFVFEAVGDYQLTKFIKNPVNKGKIMRYGLWSYSRHPNYFGEITSWWGFYLFTLFTPFWYIGTIGPLTITFLILGISGIPMLEKHYEGNREYDDYKKTTSAFFPLPWGK